MMNEDPNNEPLNTSSNNHNELSNRNEPIEVEAIEVNESIDTMMESEQVEVNEQVVANEEIPRNEETFSNEQTIAHEQIVATRVESQPENREEKQKKKRAYSPLVAGFLGAIIGSSTMLGGLLFFDDRNQTSGTTIGGSSRTPQEITVTNISSEDVTGVIAEAQESVVGVVNYQHASTNSADSLFGGQFQGQQGQAESTGELEAAGSGSGIVYKKSGDTAYIVTNHHVIENADAIEITLSDGTTLEATLVGSDQWSDLAVLEVDGSAIESVATLGDSDALLAGQAVIAIGNPLGFLDGTVTQGIISSAERSIDVDINSDGTPDWQMTVIQTDAAINPGNSGGALLNANGEVIGINSSKIADTSVEGIGFSIPINSALPILEQLEESGQVTRPQMGASLVDLSQISSNDRTQILNLPSDVTLGVVIAAVTEGSGASSAGLQMYDVITAIDGQAVESTVDVRKYLYNEKAVGDTITVTFFRDGQEQTASLTLQAAQDN